MKRQKMIQYSIMAVILCIVSSCVSSKTDIFLTGHKYLNEKTQDRMEFTKKGNVIITWSSDEGIWSGQYFSGYRKYHPYEFSYTVYDDGRKMTVLYLSSDQALHFPYSIIEISNSKDSIIITRSNGLKEIFNKKE